MEIEVIIQKKIDVTDAHLRMIRKIIEDGSIGSFEEAVEYTMKLRRELDRDTARAIVKYVDMEEVGRVA